MLGASPAATGLRLSATKNPSVTLAPGAESGVALTSRSRKSRPTPLDAHHPARQARGMTSPFLSASPERWVASNDLAFALRDNFPVSPGHTLVVPRREVATWFDATREEQVAILELVDVVKAQLDAELQPAGYNVGFNAGVAAGQTVMHLHVHVIPRFTGDVEDPRGGVRHVVPGKGNYLVAGFEAAGSGSGLGSGSGTGSGSRSGSAGPGRPPGPALGSGEDGRPRPSGSASVAVSDSASAQLTRAPEQNAMPFPSTLSGRELLHASGRPIGPTVLDFWRWHASDLTSNSLRGVFAEYIVGHLVGAQLAVRVEWDAADLRMPDGTLIEVKSAGRLQSWEQKRPSTIRFDVARKLSWNQATNVQVSTAGRVANVWVFCVQAHEDRATLDPLDLAQWQFYVLAGPVLDKALGGQKSANLQTLLGAGAVAVAAGELRAVVLAAGVVARGAAGG